MVQFMHRDQIGVRDAEMVEQEFAALQIVVEIVQPRQIFLQRVGF